MKKTYINLYTGEVIKRHTLHGARHYFKKDSKKANYLYEKTLITRFN